ncbi:MAG: serine O-acetyltransferase, partial [Streptococcus agalactiae]|nr:serine O-acetyltransferase [Streptococcus agalactiae]
VVGVPAKVVRVHGQKDDLQIRSIEHDREESYYSSKL